MKTEIVKKAVDTLRVLSAEIITHAGNGHSGIALGAAPLLYTVYASMKVDPSQPDWFNRDRFVLSAGHGSALLYSTLHMFGFDIAMDDLKQFRKYKSRTPGHPEIGVTPGVDCSTGPLGQGVAMAVGLALAEQRLARKFPNVVDHYTFCVAGDGCLMEGVSYEACNLAGLYKLNKLIMLYDKNDITLDGTRAMADGECVKMRFEAAGWNVLEVPDANTAEPIIAAIAQAKTSEGKPTLIICQTVIGFGHKTADSAKAHGAVLSAEDNAELRLQFGLAGAPFSIDKAVKKHFENLAFRKHGSAEKWQMTPELKKFIDGKQNLEVTPQGKEMAGRDSGHIYLNQIAKQSPRVWGANADISSTTKAFIVGDDIIQCGVREFAMAAICNGLALHGFTPYCSTFLAFSDYCRSAIRMSALMNLPVTYIFSHDGLGNCPDGPTHQANEHVSALRLIPNMKVFRPCDDFETAAVYKWVFEHNQPTCIIVGRGSVPLVSKTPNLKGNIVVDCVNPCAELLSTGAEVSICVAAAEMLAKSGLNVRVISIPSFELFDAKILDSTIPKIAVEMGVSDLWHKYVGPNGRIIAFDEFSHSAPQDPIMQELGVTPENIARTVLDTIKNK